MIQRELKKKRAKEISDYLCNQNERFLNSLVVAVYGGEPKWFSLSGVNSSPENFDVSQLAEDDLATVGFLSLSGEENFFALDGQHRLAGIRKALRECPARAEDEVNVIFVAHKETEEGRRRTRRLFTTLNKRAKPVSKGPIIALDEDDAMAITCRRLVEEHAWFGGERILYQATNNMPSSNRSAFTTIGALYDTLTSLFCGAHGANKEKLKYYRPSDDELDQWYGYASEFFQCLHASFGCYRKFCDAAQDFADITATQRGTHGGSVLFRPIGLIIFVDVISQFRELYEADIATIVAHCARLGWVLTEPPFVDIIWDSQAGRMATGTKILCRDLVVFMLGEHEHTDSLAKKYAKAKGVSLNDAHAYLESLECVEPLGE